MNCPPRVTRALQSIDGVKNVKVSFKDKAAKVLADAAACSEDAQKRMIKALDDANFGGTVKSVVRGTHAPGGGG